MPIVTLGNSAPLNFDGSPTDHALSVTTVEFPHAPGDNDEQIDLMEERPEHRLRIRGLGERRGLYVHLVELESVWAAHHDGADPPDWVESDDEDLAAFVSEHYGCPVGRPEGWGDAT